MAEEELEKKNFENLVWFYQDELISLNNGERANTLFSKGLRQRMMNLGVLVYKKGRADLKYLLSQTAQNLLNSLSSTQMSTQ